MIEAGGKGHLVSELARQPHALHVRVLRVLGLDDLLTDLPPGNPYAATIYRDIAGRIAAAAARCDRLVVTTEPLAEAYGSLAPEVMVIPNAIDESRWGRLENKARNGERPRVGWAGAKQSNRELFLKYSCSDRFDPFSMHAEQIRGLLLELEENVSAIKPALID